MNNRLTDEQIEALSRLVVDDWDLDTLIQYAVENIFDYYKEDNEAAQKAMLDNEWTLEDLKL